MQAFSAQQRVQKISQLHRQFQRAANLPSKVVMCGSLIELQTAGWSLSWIINWQQNNLRIPTANLFAWYVRLSRLLVRYERT